MNYYNTALQKIKCAQQTFSTGGCCCIGNIGPTGPTGPAGPATITIGTTTTGAPGSAATVTNSGTNENVILNFTIPQGITGPTGPTGATGATGPIGPAPTLAVGPVVTLPAGENAAVSITGADGAYTLNFSIPQGATGATGEQGPTGNGLAAYGGLYNANPSESLTLDDTTDGNEITMATATPVLNVSAANNNIVVQEDGDYLITYSLTITPGALINSLEFSVRNNDNDLAPSTITKTNVAASTPVSYSGSFITNLTAQDSIDMALTDSAGSGTVTINSATLNVSKLDAGTPAV